LGHRSRELCRYIVTDWNSTSWERDSLLNEAYELVKQIDDLVENFCEVCCRLARSCLFRLVSQLVELTNALEIG
jgi:hypothetical protein